MERRLWDVGWFVGETGREVCDEERREGGGKARPGRAQSSPSLLISYTGGTCKCVRVGADARASTSVTATVCVAFV